MGIVTSLTNGLSEREANDALNAHVSVSSLRDEKSCLEEITRGVLYLHGAPSEGVGAGAMSEAQRPGGWEEAGEQSALAALSLSRIPRAFTVKRQSDTVALVCA